MNSDIEKSDASEPQFIPSSNVGGTLAEAPLLISIPFLRYLFG
eukprot:CAMPEP_0114660900 /NCGR_PEP_ID=MMETSP0191-20121206/21219_1 /TAXON_ID=126664 /ORGANISM="Sorites sp." /LENGTH=42 /DNA_ID= /DNA_START= /DNA_END= /DNA_ORIENTATION=